VCWRKVNPRISDLLVQSVKYVLNGMEGVLRPTDLYLNAVVKDGKIYFFSDLGKVSSELRSDFPSYRLLIRELTPGTSVFYNPKGRPDKFSDYNYPIIHNDPPYRFEYDPERDLIAVTKESLRSVSTYIKVSSEVSFYEAFAKAKKRLDSYEKTYVLQEQIGDAWVSDELAADDGEKFRLAVFITDVERQASWFYFLVEVTDRISEEGYFVTVKELARVYNSPKKLMAFYQKLTTEMSERKDQTRYNINGSTINPFVEMLKRIYGSLERALLIEYEHNPMMVQRILYHKYSIINPADREIVDAFDFMMLVDS